MSRNLLISMVLLCLACRTMSQETQETDDTQILVGGVDYGPVLRAAGETYRAGVEKVQTASEAVKSFAQNSYEDHIKPIVEPSVAWVTEATSSVWDKIKTRMSDFWSEADSQ